MKAIVSKGEFKLLKVIVFIFLTLGFDLISPGIAKSIVFAILLASIILEVYSKWN